MRLYRTCSPGLVSYLDTCSAPAAVQSTRSSAPVLAECKGGRNESMARAFVALRGADPDDHDALSDAVQDAAAELQAGLADRSMYSKTEAAQPLGCELHDA